MTRLPPPTFEDPERRSRLASALPDVESVFRAYAEEAGVPGLAYGVVIDGELAAVSAVGSADVAGGRGLARDGVFRIASMTKSVTACCVCRLRDEGVLSLDDPAVRHVHELADIAAATADSPSVTIRQLLTMSAGLVNDDPWADRQLAMPREAFGALLRDRLRFHAVPGTTFEYSNLGYSILGRVVENLTGRLLADVAREWLFEPLGMADTTFRIEEVDPERIVRGHSRYEDELEPEPALADGAFGAMAGLWTTVADFARYTAMHLAAWPPREDPETLPLPRATLREMAQAWRAMDVSDRPGVVAGGYGYGLMSLRHGRDGHLVGHPGGLPGYGSYVEWLPEHGVGVLAFANLTYARVRDPVREAFNALARTGALLPRRPAPSHELIEARDWLSALLREWDDARFLALAADNLPLDLSAQRRRTAFARLRESHGELLEAGPVDPDGALSGRFELRCARGVLDAEFLLTPTEPPRVQWYELTPRTDGAQASS